ncbi:hypothetical protein BGX21_006570 [Mortierella sp. AD011]|nr:hypothetical protein BGX20_007051 [Mortierella sp. AD010]KAF9368457.1 hypothetical protein BGX21_006570 [Mortierella sp. AD011]
MIYRPPTTPRKSTESCKRTTGTRSVVGSPRLSDSDDASSLPDDEPRMLDDQVFTQKPCDPRLSSSSQCDAAVNPDNAAASPSNTNNNPSTVPDAAAPPAISFAHTNLENKPTGLAPNPTPTPTPYARGDIPPKASKKPSTLPTEVGPTLSPRSRMHGARFTMMTFHQTNEQGWNDMSLSSDNEKPMPGVSFNASTQGKTPIGP